MFFRVLLKNAVTIKSVFFRLEGQVLSQMLRKSIETRDWLNNVEPRSVRAVMKRVVEETTSIGKKKIPSRMGPDTVKRLSADQRAQRSSTDVSN